MKKLSIIIPAYNEERSISQILGKIHQTRLIGETEKEILIIDDGSKDSTAPDFVNVSPKNHLQIMGRYVDVVS